MLMISTLAGIVGSVGYGWISDKWFGARRPPADLIFGVCEILGLALIFFGPANMPTLVAGMILFGLGLAGLVMSLGGLFAVDICPKRATGAAMGVIGIFSYLGAALQENISGQLLDQHSHMVGADRVYDFEQSHLVLARLVGRVVDFGGYALARKVARLTERYVGDLIFVVFLRVAPEQHLHASEHAVLVEPDVRVLCVEADKLDLRIVLAFEPGCDEGDSKGVRWWRGRC